VFSSSALSVLLTLAFAVTGAFSLIRLAGLTAAADRPADRLVELFHLVMSLAMIGMTWAWSGGPDSRSGLLQIVVFGAFGLWFGHALIRGLGHDPVAQGSHLTMAGATVWMIAAMPVLMGVTGSPTGVGGHAGHGGHGSSGDATPTVDPGPAAAPPAVAVAVTVVFAVLLVGFAVAAAVRATRPGAAGCPEPAPTGGVAVLTAPTDVTTRLAPWSHALMNLAMAAMLAAML
jgi:hypothetical protein